MLIAIKGPHQYRAIVIAARRYRDAVEFSNSHCFDPAGVAPQWSPTSLSSPQVPHPHRPVCVAAHRYGNAVRFPYGHRIDERAVAAQWLPAGLPGPQVPQPDKATRITYTAKASGYGHGVAIDLSDRHRYDLARPPSKRQFALYPCSQVPHPYLARKSPLTTIGVPSIFRWPSYWSRRHQGETGAKPATAPGH